MKPTKIIGDFRGLFIFLCSRSFEEYNYSKMSFSYSFYIFRGGINDEKVMEIREVTRYKIRIDK